SGLCQAQPVECPEDFDPLDCWENVCLSATGTCGPQFLDGNVCDDGNMCTHNDTCQVGVCQGVLPPEDERSVECGRVIPAQSSGSDTATIVVVSLAGLGAVLGAVAGV